MAGSPAFSAKPGDFYLPRLRRHTALFVLAAIPAASAAIAAPFQSAQDTSKVYRYGEIVVSAERYPVSAEKAGAVSYGIARDPSWDFGGPGSSLSGGRNIHLAPYGGGMSLQTVSIRGMGAEHTLFLWNGMPAGNMQTGVSDVNLFSAADLDEIQVVPGGASAIHGTAAVGGVVNLVPASPLDAPPSLDIGATSGSFGETGVFVRGRVRPTAVSGLSVRASSMRGRGDYPFGDPATGAEEVRRGADYSSRALNLSAGLDHAGAGRFGLVVNAMSLDQGSPGPWIPSAPEPDARRNDQRLMAGLSYEGREGDGPPVTAAAMVDMQYERYLDPTGIAAADNYYRTTWAGASGQFRRAAGESWLFQAGTEFRYERAAGNAIDSTRERLGAAIAASAAWTLRLGDETDLTLTPSLRAEGVSSFAPRYSPRVGVNAEWRSDGAALRLHGSAAGASRNPTMNELWYAGEGGTGNPGLRSESALSFDAGAGGRVRFLGLLSADLTWYGIAMTDRIQWVPTENPRVWTPMNIGRTRSTGWEVSGRWTVSPDEIEFDADYSMIDSKRGDLSSDGTTNYDKQLTYVPLDKGSAGVLIGKTGLSGWLDALSGTTRIIYTGDRYTLDDNSASLPGHAIAEAGVSARFFLPGGTATLRYTAGNLAGLDYQVMPGYPMPRFYHSLSIVWHIGV
jgi:vitamin B12 transporter